MSRRNRAVVLPCETPADLRRDYHRRNLALDRFAEWRRGPGLTDPTLPRYVAEIHAANRRAARALRLWLVGRASAEEARRALYGVAYLAECAVRPPAPVVRLDDYRRARHHGAHPGGAA